MPWRTIDVELRANIAGFRAQLGAAGAAVQDFARQTTAGITGAGKSAAQLRQSAEQLSQVGGILTRSVTLPLVAAGVAGVKFASDFETTFSRIAGLTDIPAEEIGRLRESVLSLAGETARSPQELAEGLYLAASAGLDADAAMAVVATSAKAAAAGMGDTATVVDLVTGVVNAYGAANITAAQATDILTAAVRTGKAEPDEFANTLGRVLPLASQLGVGFDQVAAAVATLTNGSIDADVAATGLRQVFSDILQPGKQAEVQLRAIGINSAQLRQTLRDEGLLAALDLLKTQIGGNQEAVGKIIPDIRALTTILSLMGQDGDRVAAIFDATKNSTGALDKAFDAFQKTSAAKLKQALVDNQTALIQLGETLLPLAADVLPPIVAGIRAMVDLFGALPGPVKVGVVAIAGIAAAAGPVLMLVGNLRRMRAFLVGSEGIAGGFTTAAGRAGAFKTALGGIAVTAGMIAVQRYFDERGRPKREAEKAVQEALTAVGSDLEARRKALEEWIRRGSLKPIVANKDDPTGFKMSIDESFEHRQGPEFVDAAKRALADLRLELKGQEADTRRATAATKEHSGAVAGITTDYTAAAEAADTWAKSLGGFTSLLDAQRAADDLEGALSSLKDAQDELSTVNADAAKLSRDVAGARDDEAAAAVRVTDAQEALRKAKEGVTALEREELQVARDQAAERQMTAKRDAEDAQKHLDRLKAAGRSPKAIQDAEDALATARQADVDAQESQKKLDDARVGSPAYAKAVAAAERDLRDAQRQQADAVDRVTQAQRDAKTPAELLADRQRKVRDAMRDVETAALNLQKANIAAGITPATEATAALITKLQELRDKWPTLAGPINDLILKLNAPVAPPPTVGSTIPAPPHETYPVQGIGGGGSAPQHQALGGITTAPTILYGERQTGGEAFVPRLGISRARGLALAGVAAGWHGGRVVPMAEGGWSGPRMAVDAGRSRVEVVRVVERHETHAPTYELHGGDARSQIRELETMRRREQISRSLSDASANDWTR